MDNNLFPSAWTSYPERYKFLSIQIQVSDIIKVTSRETYSLLEFLGDIGGLAEFVFIFISFFAKRFGQMNLQAFLANKMYSWEFD